MTLHNDGAHICIYLPCCMLQLPLGRVLQELHHHCSPEQRPGAIVSSLVLGSRHNVMCPWVLFSSPCLVQAELEVFAPPQALYVETPSEVN